MSGYTRYPCEQPSGDNTVESSNSSWLPMDPWGHWEECKWVTGKNDPCNTGASTFEVNREYYTSRQDAIDDFLKYRNGLPEFKSGEARCHECGEYGKDNFTPKVWDKWTQRRPNSYIMVWCKGCMIDQFWEDSTISGSGDTMLCQPTNIGDDEGILDEIDNIRKKTGIAIQHITNEILTIEHDIELLKYSVEISKTESSQYEDKYQNDEKEYSLHKHKKVEHETEIGSLTLQLTQTMSKIEELYKLCRELGWVAIEGNTDTLKETISAKLDQEKGSLKDIEIVFNSKQLEKEQSNELFESKQKLYLELQDKLNKKEVVLEGKRKLLQQKIMVATNHTSMLLKIEFNNRMSKLNKMLFWNGITYAQGKKMCETMDSFINIIPVPVYNT